MVAKTDWVDKGPGDPEIPHVNTVFAEDLNALGTEVNSKQASDSDLTALAALTAPATKLAGIATGATVNSSDATLLARANHTGTQTAATISDLAETVEDLIGSKVVAGSNVTVTYNDAAGTTTVASTGGSGTVDATTVNAAGAVMEADTSTAAMAFVVDEDSMTSNSATKVPTQQSVKAYVDGVSTTVNSTNVNAAGAVMEADTSTASMSFVLDEDSMTSNSATKIPTQQSVKAYVDANASVGATNQESTYIITTSGGTITATARAGSGFSNYSGSSASTVIQNAINALTPSGSNGSGGGKIKVCQGTYGLNNQLTITGWEGIVGSNSQPNSQLVIEGDGMSTTFMQNTSGQNCFKINNCANVVLRDFKIYCGTAARSGILGDNDGATSVMSMWKSVIDNVHVNSDSTGYPGVLLKDFFDLSVPWLRVQCPSNTGVTLQQTDSAVKRGNSWFGTLVSMGSQSSPHAGLKIESTTNAAAIDLITFDNVQITTSAYYGIYCKNAMNINFVYTDLEDCQYCVYLDGFGSGSYTSSAYVTFGQGYWQPRAGAPAGFYASTNSYASKIDGVEIRGAQDGSIPPLVDARSGSPASDYNIFCDDTDDINAISVAYAGTKLKVTGASTYIEKLPDGTRLVPTTKTGSGSGTAGQIAVDANYIYVATGSNTWKRAALSTF